jgi:hypothetical protein
MPATSVNSTARLNIWQAMWEMREDVPRPTSTCVMEASIPESRRPDALEVGAWFHLRPLGAIPSRSAVFFQFRTHQANRGSARSVHEVENLGNHLKLERTVTLKKSNAMSTQSEELFETTA